MKLMIVESPVKVKTIRQFVSNDFVVKASVGHVCEINNSGLYNLGIDVKNNFNVDFKISDNKKEVVEELKGLVVKAEEVFVATDLD